MRKYAASLMITLLATQAWGYGTFAGPEGSTIAMTASRTAIVRSTDAVELIFQAKYAGTPTELVWLIALPNFNDPDEDGVVFRQGDQAVLDALDAQTRPTFEGACEGVPNGQMAEEVFGGAPFGPANNAVLPRRFFPVPNILNGDLANYLASISVTVDEPLQAGIDWAADQNLMIAAIRINTADLGVNKIDPIASVRYPLAPGADVRFALRLTASSTPTNPSDLLMWVLAGERRQASLTTREMDFGGVSFVGGAQTNYLAAFDQFVAATQTRTLVTEHAGAAIIGGFDSAAVDAVLDASGAGYVTRLHARLAAAALRAAGSDSITLRPGGGGDYARAHTVAGFMCGGDEPDAGGPPADAGVNPTPDSGTPLTDAAPNGGNEDAAPSEDDDGGGGGGCTAADAPVACPLLAFLLVSTLRRRRMTRAAHR